VFHGQSYFLEEFGAEYNVDSPWPQGDILIVMNKASLADTLKRQSA